MTNKNNIYLHYGSSLNSSYIYKKLGLNSPTNIFYIKDREDEYFYAPFFEFDYLKKFSKNKNIRNLSELQGSNSNYFNAITNFLKRKNKTVIVPASFPSWLFDRMTKDGLHVLVGDSYFFRTLLIKDESELEMIQKTAEIVKECFVYIKDILDKAVAHKGLLYFKERMLSSKLLSEMINIFLAKRNTECELLIIACGEFAYYPHCQNEHFLMAGKPIIIAIEPGAYIKGVGGIRIEDTYLITRNGNVNLTRTHQQ